VAPALPLWRATTIDFLRDEVVEICAALALGGSLLRRLGLCAEAGRLEALFGAVESRLAAGQCSADSVDPAGPPARPPSPSAS
jgi:hypothetical protein